MTPAPVVAVLWWCCRVEAPWTWVWHPYVGVWILVGLVFAAYEWAWHRRRPRSADRRRRTMQFLGGLFFLWLASDWPLGTLGASYLVTAHMADYLLYVLAAAPLLVLGTPEWLARRVLEKLRCYRALRLASRPIVAGIFFNVALVGTHAPVTVDTLRTTPGGSFFLDMVWLASGMLLWIPICSPLKELRIRSSGLQAVYLWLVVGVVCTVPSAFLIFARYPLYRSFELAPRLYGISAKTDQQTAGVLMKLGPMPVIWTIIFVLLWRWFEEDEQRSALARVARGISEGSRGGVPHPTELPTPGAGPPAPEGHGGAGAPGMS